VGRGRRSRRKCAGWPLLVSGEEGRSDMVGMLCITDPLTHSLDGGMGGVHCFGMPVA